MERYRRFRRIDPETGQVQAQGVTLGYVRWADSRRPTAGPVVADHLTPDTRTALLNLKLEL